MKQKEDSMYVKRNAHSTLSCGFVSFRFLDFSHGVTGGGMLSRRASRWLRAGFRLRSFRGWRGAEVGDGEREREEDMALKGQIRRRRHQALRSQLGSAILCQPRHHDGKDRHGGKLTLDKGSQDLAPCLQQGMTDDDLEELLEACATTFDNIVAEAVGEDLSGQRRNSDTGALALENVAEVLEVGVSTTDAALTELEGGNVCAAEDLVVCVHVTAHAMCSWVADL